MRYLDVVSYSKDLTRLVATQGQPVTVHSVFRRAMNLSLAASGETEGKPSLITVAQQDVGNLPGALLVQAGTSFSFEREFAPGDKGMLAARRLYLRDMMIDLRHGQPWDSRLARIDHWCETWLERWDVAWYVLSAEGEGRGRVSVDAGTLHSALAEMMRGRVRRMARACMAMDAPAAGQAGRDLVGLGPGLTPWGDDFLVGLWAGLWAHTLGALHQSFIDALAAQIETALPRTNDVSASYLGWAMQGRVGQRLHDLIYSITGAQAPAQVMARTRNALAAGATSGAAGVFGTLLALAAWPEPYRHSPAARRSVAQPIDVTAGAAAGAQGAEWWPSTMGLWTQGESVI